MARKKNEEPRMLQEALETAAGFNSYGVMYKTDMGKIRALCEQPPEYTARGWFSSERASPKSARPYSPPSSM